MTWRGVGKLSDRGQKTNETCGVQRGKHPVPPTYFLLVDFRHFSIMHFFMPPWFTEELSTAALEDKRLNERFAEILEALGKSPHASIPAALGGRAELKAAYRFCDNDKVTPQKILQPHHHATTKRCQQQKIVLCVQDTSELDFTRPQQQVAGAGPLACSSRLGAFLHLNEAFTEDGTPLGAIDAKLWAREEPDPDAPKLSKVEKE